VSRPAVGITAVADAYSPGVQAAGALALLLPPDDAVAEAPAELLDLLDALLLAGGCDIDPGSYGAREHPETRGTSPERDRFELALAHAALERGLPVLGIGRGMQMLNVACGGTLVQHLPEHGGDHELRLEPGSLAARAAGAERLAVSSDHHQGLAELGEGVEAVGWAPDEVIEAIELPGRGFALGVLWCGADGVVAALVEAARGERQQ
jgi:putative glutamine amidotransferase